MLARFVFFLMISVSTLASAFADSAPSKFLDANLRRKATLVGPFKREHIANKTYVKIKHSEWGACRRNQNAFYSLDLGGQDSISNFLDGAQPTNTLESMETLQLLQGRAKKAPWSGDYWPYASGLLGARYLDRGFNRLFDWEERFDYIKDKSARNLLNRHGQKAVERLSPSEKYDLIIGDQNMSLTRWMWLEGKRYFDDTGKVESWMGICHGWAPAAIMEPRPARSIAVSSYDNRYSVPLRPAELKGLISYSWASNYYPNVFLGHRCEKKDPLRDAEGRLVDPECFDLNPATWHIAMVNRLGAQGKSFVMDATYDYEVWNQPVLSYSYSYFNVETKQPEASLEKAMVRREDFSTDKFSKYRSQEVKYIVGILMKLSYVMEAEVTDSSDDSEKDDAIRWVEYRYDLEINRDGKIIGGEWYSTGHPDFIWTPVENAQPRAPLDNHLNVNMWSGHGAIPYEWADRARESAPQGNILNTLTKALLLRAAL